MQLSSPERGESAGSYDCPPSRYRHGLRPCHGSRRGQGRPLAPPLHEGDRDRGPRILAAFQQPFPWGMLHRSEWWGAVSWQTQTAMHPDSHASKPTAGSRDRPPCGADGGHQLTLPRDDGRQPLGRGVPRLSRNPVDRVHVGLKRLSAVGRGVSRQPSSADRNSAEEFPAKQLRFDALFSHWSMRNSADY